MSENNSETISQTKKKWRSLVRIEEVFANSVVVVVPSWNPRQALSLRRDIFPDDVAPWKRYHAMVNIGAESALDIEFADWDFSVKE